MEYSDWTVVDWLMLLVPVLIGLFSVRIGAAQMREFHRRTGDKSMLVTFAGLSRFVDEAKGSRLPEARAKISRPAWLRWHRST